MTSKTAPTPRANGRIEELDSIRGIAALAVVLFHYTTRYQELVGPHRPALPFGLPWGGYGVCVFFMLSGFVIFMTLERSKSAASFALGRFTRLYPAYWAALALTFAAVQWWGLPGQETTLCDALWNLSMVQSLVHANHVDGAYWSLQAEVLFYANMLALWCLGAFRRPRTTMMLWVLLATASCLLGKWGGLPEPVAALNVKAQTLLCLNYIYLFVPGMVLYRHWKHGAFGKLEFALVMWCAGMLTIVDGIESFVACCAGWVLLVMAIGGKAVVLRSKPLLWLGSISYTLYLIHQNLGYIAMRELQNAGILGWQALLIAIIGALILAQVFTLTVERFGMTKLRRWAESVAVSRAMAGWKFQLWTGWTLGRRV